MMSISRLFTPDPHGTPRLHWRLWIVFAILIAAGIAVDGWQDYRDRAAGALHAARCQRIQRRTSEIARRFAPRQSVLSRVRSVAAYYQLPVLHNAVSLGEAWLARTSGFSKRELEQQLNNGLPFRYTSVNNAVNVGYGPNSSLETALYTPPGEDYLVELRFVDGIFIDAISPEAFASPLPLSGRLVCEAIGTSTAQITWWLWLGLLPLPFVLRRHRVLLAELLILAALLYTIQRLPRLRSLDWDTIVHHDYLPWGLAMSAIGLAILSYAYYHQAYTCRILCSLCGYNLRGCVGSACPECGTAIPRDVQNRLAKLQANAPSPHLSSMRTPHTESFPTL